MSSPYDAAAAAATVKVLAHQRHSQCNRQQQQVSGCHMLISTKQLSSRLVQQIVFRIKT
jgi:hypothetical protein